MQVKVVILCYSERKTVKGFTFLKHGFLKLKISNRKNVGSFHLDILRKLTKGKLRDLPDIELPSEKLGNLT